MRANLKLSAHEFDCGAYELEVSAHELEPRSHEFGLSANECELSANELELSAKELEPNARELKLSAQELELSANEFELNAGESELAQFRMLTFTVHASHQHALYYSIAISRVNGFNRLHPSRPARLLLHPSPWSKNRSAGFAKRVTIND